MYSFSVSDPTATITFTVDRQLGQENAYVLTANPTQPWVQPPTSYTWQFYPTFFSPSLSIAPTDSKLTCTPSADAPCLYYIALTAVENQPARFFLTATADALPIRQLFDGQPTSGSVLDGSLNYYTFVPASASVPPPPVAFTWSNLYGAVALYVTNAYYPGVSAPGALPGPGSAVGCQWVCTNFTLCYVDASGPCYKPSGPNGAPVVYTVAVLGSSTNFSSGGGGPGTINNEYTLTATNAGDPIALSIGLPTSDIVLFGGTNTTFYFDIELPDGWNPGQQQEEEVEGEEGEEVEGGQRRLQGRARYIPYDVLISASVNHGAVQMLVAPAFAPGIGGANPPPPDARPPPRAAPCCSAPGRCGRP